MELYRKNSFVINIFILTFVNTSLCFFTYYHTKDIDGSIKTLELDNNCYAYGIEALGMTTNSSSKSPFTPTPWHYYLFKLDTNEKVIWKLKFDEILVYPIDIPSRGSEPIFLINSRNDFYLLDGKDNFEIYTPIFNDSVPILKTVSVYRTPFLSRPGFDEVLIIDDNIFFFGLPDDVRPSKTSIKILNVKSGKWLTVASSERYELFWVFDYYRNLYFVKKDGCDSYTCESIELGPQQLFVLVNDSLKEDSPKPRIIKGVIDKEEAVELRISLENELIIRFESGSTAILETVNNRDKSRFAQEESQASEANSISSIFRYKIDLTDLIENDTIIALSSSVVSSVREENKHNASLRRESRSSEEDLFKHISVLKMINDCLRQIDPNGQIVYKSHKQMNKISKKRIPLNQPCGQNGS